MAGRIPQNNHAPVYGSGCPVPFPLYHFFGNANLVQNQQGTITFFLFSPAPDTVPVKKQKNLKSIRLFCNLFSLNGLPAPALYGYCPGCHLQNVRFGLCCILWQDQYIR